MYFGNSKVNINTSIGCDIYNLTPNNFVVEIETGIYKDNVFLAYIDGCPEDFQDISSFFEFSSVCLDADRWYQCDSELFDAVQLGVSCQSYISGDPNLFERMNLKVIYNTYDNLGDNVRKDNNSEPFNTTRNPLGGGSWGCPENFSEREKTRLNLGCYAYFDIGMLGLNSSEEINSCNFLLFASQAEESSEVLPIDPFPATVNIYYLDGDGNCNMITLSQPADPCLPYVVCWPPSGSPWSDPDLDPCSPEGCESLGGNYQGDICNFNPSVKNISPRCRCPQSVPCFERADDYSNRNCFIYPGLSSGEPCVDGSWDGSSCTSGYNGVCISGTCVNRICKELDWIIDNYAGASEGFTGYASFVEQFSNDPTGYQQLKDWYYLSCSPKSVEIINDINQPITVTFGDTPTQRSWDRIIYRLSQFAKNGIEDKSQTKVYLPFSEPGCSSSYPVQVCCVPVFPGSVNYDCPVCPITGFADNYEEPTCCCDQSITPILFGLGNEIGIGAPDGSDIEGEGGGGGGGPGGGLG